MTSSRTKNSTVETTNVCDNQSLEKGEEEENSNEVEVTYSAPTHTLRSIKIERQSPQPSEDVVQQTNNETTSTQNIECTSSSGQQTSADNSEPQNESEEQQKESEEQQNIVHNNNTEDENGIDIQEIAFDCFYSNDFQQMQTFGSSEATTSSTLITTSDVNSLLVLNTNDHQNNQIISSSEPIEEQITDNNCEQLFTSSDLRPEEITVGNNNQIFTTNTTSVNSYTIRNNNVVMKSPIHSDGECILLDSLQHQTGYEVTIGSEGIYESIDKKNI